MKKKIGVLLSGCGVKDGAEIHEAVLTLLSLDRAGVEAVCMAPDKDQVDVIDHRSDKPVKEKRNVLVESARIARGNITDLSEVDPKDLDGVVIPGGFGAAKNLCTFAVDGEACTVDPDVGRLLRELHADGKPIAALCIAPSILAAVFGKPIAPEITIGADEPTAAALEKMGAKHQVAEPTQVVIDVENKIVTTPCYMNATRIGEIALGAEKAVNALLALSRETIAS